MLTEKAATSITIKTQPLSGGRHNVHFNRGAIASQAFVKRFPGMKLDEAGPPAFAWLAHDLLPAHFKAGSEKDIKRRYFADE